MTTQSPKDLCILISTFPDCLDIAEFTALRIKKFWEHHPHIFFCGVKEGELPVSSISSDWMTILLESCDKLWQQGFRKIYLILDDHPPLGPCHSLHLNKTIPSVMQEFQAICISLLGTGQGRPPFGRPVASHGFSFDHIHPNQLWKFSLHPALWNLEILRGLLRTMIGSLPHSERTPWAFERWGGSPEAPFPTDWKSASYRIEGHSMRMQNLHPLIDIAKRPARGLELFAHLFGKGALVQRPLGFLRHFYDGPYPLIWSGLMKKKAVNPDFLYYSRLAAKKDFLENLPARFSL
jgi:hypothetical protein